VNSVRWAIQTNLGSAEDIAKLIDCLEAQKIPVERLKIVPFDDTPPDVSTEGRVIFYGSTTLMNNVLRAARWTPGVFFDPARFDFSALHSHYGEHLLNADSEVVPVHALLARNYTPDHELFLRPSGDLKEFIGRVYTFGELDPWRDGLASSHGPLTLDSLVQIAEPKVVIREWRTVVVNGTVIASSQYRSHGRKKVTGDVPAEVIAFATARAAEYAPAPVFVLDVGETERGLRVVETNCFNSAGFYWCDLWEVARCVTAYVQQAYPPA
jgi:hypothetical protein